MATCQDLKDHCRAVGEAGPKHEASCEALRAQFSHVKAASDRGRFKAGPCEVRRADVVDRDGRSKGQGAYGDSRALP